MLIILAEIQLWSIVYIHPTIPQALQPLLFKEIMTRQKLTVPK